MRATGAAGVALFVLSLVLGGCLGFGAEPKDSTQIDYAFSESRGPGGVSPLIPLTDDAAADAAAILAACRERTDLIGCSNEHLKAVLGAVGSMHAFDVLAEMSAQDARIQTNDHPMAHVLGRYALYVYGTIGNTLTHCSHKVFQGCLHGALQEFFEHVGALDALDLDAVCPGGSNFEIYACMHGLGHGLVLATDYDLPRSLDLCASLRTDFAQRSCHGGAFMENVVAHNDHVRAGGSYPGYTAYVDQYGPIDEHTHGHHGHVHGDDSAPPPRYWIEPDDPLFPCNAVAQGYQDSCWRMQTSMVLFLNGGNFLQTAQVCGSLDEWLHDACFNSLGRDASAWSKRDPHGVANRCATAPTDATRALCIQGAVGELVTNYADPSRALPFCLAIPAVDKAACYEGMGRSARNHRDTAGLEALCAEADPDHVSDCKRGARL